VKLTRKEGTSMRGGENRVLRAICVPEREEVSWDWRKPHSEELRYLHHSPDIIG